MSQPITVIAIVTGKPETRPELEAAIRACIPPTRAEPACVSYEAKRDPGTPGRYVFVESWQDQAALDSHMQTPHLKALGAAFQRLEASLEIMTLEALD